MTEHSFVKAVHRQLPREIKVWKIIDDMHGGVSDALYFGTKGRLLFVEYKFVPALPVRPITVVAKTKLPPLQAEWHKDLAYRDVPIAAIIGCGEPRKYKGVWLEDPREVKTGIRKCEFQDRLETIKELATHISQRLL